MGIKERAAEHIEVQTHAGEDAIRDACRRAMEAGKVTLQSTIREARAENGDRLLFEVMGPGKLVRQMLFEVTISENGSNQRTVQTVIHKYLVTQSKS